MNLQEPSPHRRSYALAGLVASALTASLLLAMLWPTMPKDSVADQAVTSQVDWDSLQLPRQAQNALRQGPVHEETARLLDHDRVVTDTYVEERWLYENQEGQRPLVRRVIQWRPDAQGAYRFRSLEEAVGDHLMIRVDSEKDQAALADLAAELDMELSRAVGSQGYWLLRFPAGDLAAMDSAEQLLRQQPWVQEVGVDMYYYPASEPDDPRFEDQWNLKNTGQNVRRQPLVSDNWDGTPGVDVNVLPAWDITRGHSSFPVAVIDSGMAYDHPDLQGSLWHDPYERSNGLDDNGSGKIDDLRGWNFEFDNNAPTDGHSGSHGTKIAGIIAARVNNNEGIAGMVPEGTVMPLRTNFWLSQIIPAIEYSADRGVRVSNNSYGGYIDQPALGAAMEYAGSLGQLMVVCAMNSGHDLDNLSDDQYFDDEPLHEDERTRLRREQFNDHTGNYTGYMWYPAMYTYDFQVTVSSLTPVNDVYEHHNWGGETVEIAAPGVGVWSTTRNGAYNFDHGTSFATPHVAAAAALMLSVNPHLTPQQLRSLLMESGTPHNTTNGASTASGKRLNTHAAVLAALGDKTGVAHLRDWHISDDPADYAGNNDDGFWNNGELLAIRADLDVLGLEATQNMQVELQVDGPATIEGSAVQSIPDQTPGSHITLEPFFLRIASDAVNDSAIELRLVLSMDNGHGMTDLRVIYTATSNSASGQITSRDDGSSISGAQLTWTHPHHTFSTVSGDSGFYSLDLIEGEYQVRVQADGFVDTVKQVSISGGVHITQNFSLGNPLWDRQGMEGITIHVRPGESAIGMLPVRNDGTADLVLEGVFDRGDYTRQESSDPGGIAWQWTDISNHPQAVELNDLWAEGTIPRPMAAIELPFRFPFYDRIYTQVIPQYWGYMHFVAQDTPTLLQQPSASSFRLPATLGSNEAQRIDAMFAYLWGDIRTIFGGHAHYLLEDTRFILQLTEVARGGGSDREPVTLQLQLHRDGRIDIFYQDVGSPQYHTIGMQADAAHGQTEVHRTSFGGTGPSISDETVWRFLPRLRLDGQLTVGPDSQEAYTVLAQAYDLSPGTYQHSLTLSSNELNGEPLTVPITLIVSDDAPVYRRIRMQRLPGHAWVLDPGPDERTADVTSETREDFLELEPSEAHSLQPLSIEANQ